jgi:hypothetical protein
LSQHLPHPELPAVKLDSRDRTTSCRSLTPTSDRDRNDTDRPPGWDALVALARLLGRQAARDHMAEGD